MGRLFLYLLLLGTALGIAWYAGYRFHPENLPYYYKLDPAVPKQNILLRDGDSFVGSIVEEKGDSLKIDIGGASTLFRKTEIESVQSVKGENPWELFWANYKKQGKKHPLVTRVPVQSLREKIDYMMTEPSRIADQIREEHPEITGQGQQAAAVEAMRQVQQRADAVRREAMAEAENNQRQYGLE